MVESYVKISSGKEYVYQPCCDGYALRGKFGEPFFFRAFKTWKELVAFAGKGSKIAFNVPLTRGIEASDWEYMESLVIVD